MHARTATTGTDDQIASGPAVVETAGDAAGRATMDGARLAYRPALTGLRAIAVIGVVLTAAGHSWIPGGRTAGIETLFVVSGYLTVTKLARGGPSLTTADGIRGVAGRARRVLPALLTVLGGVSVLVLATQPAGLFGLGSQIRAAVLGVSNWQLILSSGGDAAASPLAHLWPIAVAAQLTLVVAVAMMIATTRRARALMRTAAIVGTIVAAATLTTMIAGSGVTSRLLYGTDTRAGGLLLGVVLALTVQPVASGRLTGIRARRLRTVGLLAVIGIVGTMLVGGEGAGWVGTGGLLLTDLLAVVAVAAIVRGAPLGMLTSAGMRWVGLRSYAIYLWHWPVVLALGGPATVARPVTTAVYLLAVLVLGDATYRFVELPLGVTWRVEGSGTVGRPGVAVGVASVACGAACAAALLISPA